MLNINQIRNRMLGCLYGQAIGDAMGLGTEFLSKNEIVKAYPNGLSKYEDIIQDAHRRRWNKGAWTDDTDMMICIMTAFEEGHFNKHKVATHFKKWFESEPLGIGNHTYNVLFMGDYVKQPELCSKLCWKLSRKRSAANGALMRTSVVGLAPDNVDEQAEEICKLTHYDPRCVGSCVITSSVIHNIVWNNRKMSFDEVIGIGNKYDDRIAEWVELAYLSEDIASLNLDEHDTMGYTLRTLSAALWCYWHATSFEYGLLTIVNEGGDADTNAATSCAILGAKFGYDAIPSYYVENLNNRPFYDERVNRFMDNVLNVHE